MAGRPKTRKAIAALAPHEDEIFEHLADGSKVQLIAEHYSELTGVPISRGLVYAFFHSTPEREEKFKQARKISAGVLVEQSEDILERAALERDLSTAQASIAKERSSTKRWIASRVDRETFGDQQPGVEVNVSIGQLHLEALRKANAEDHERRLAAEPEHDQIQEAEVLAVLPAETSEESVQVPQAARSDFATLFADLIDGSEQQQNDDDLPTRRRFEITS